MKKWLYKFKNWKPIHLCWLFRKLHLPIPRYLIGGGTDFFLQGGRIANATRVWQAAQDVDVIDWDKTSDFIVAAMFETDSHGGGSTTFYLHWRNVTDGGSFGMLGSSGELTYNADTDLVNGTAVIHSEEGITARYPANHEDGKEIEGASFRVCILAQVYHEEFQFAVDCSNAHDGDEYEFAIYDSEAAVYVGTLACTITMASAGDVTVYPDAQALASTLETPTIIVVANVIVEPSVLSLTGILENPTIIAVKNITIQPNALSLIATLEVPTIVEGIGIIISPSALALTGTAEVPTILLGVTISPSVLTLIDTLYDPTIITPDVVVFPDILLLVYTLESPTVSGEGGRPVTHYTEEAKPSTTYAEVTKPSTSYEEE